MHHAGEFRLFRLRSRYYRERNTVTPDTYVTQSTITALHPA